MDVFLGRPGGVDLAAAAHYFGTGEIEECRRSLHAAIAVGHPIAHELHACLLHQAGDISSARAETDSALVAAPESVFLLVLSGVLHLQSGDFSTGLTRVAKSVELRHRAPELPLWNGEPLNGRSVFIPRTLDGIGDEIMWARFAPALARQGVRVYLQCAPVLKQLFGSLEGVTLTDGPAGDCFTYMQSIPAVLGITRDTIPRPPYIASHGKAPSVDSAKLNVGIAWGCGNLGPADRYCALAEFAELGRVSGVQLYSLEKSSHAEQLYPQPSGMEVVDLGRAVTDFTDTAAAINAMDVIVSTDNVVANLAGALGKPTFVLVPHRGEFRWGETGASPWYPSAYGFQQASPGDWREIVAGIAELVSMMQRSKLRAAAVAA